MKTATILALIVSAAPLLAQKPAAIDVTVQQVNDRRTNGSFAELAITLELPKMKSSEIAASRVLIAAATDDSGRSLIDPAATEPQLEPNMRGGGSDGPPSPATVTVRLANPDRKATRIKEVRGEIELYMPSRDANSVADVPKFLSSAGKPLTQKALKANAVEIALLSSTQIDAERKRLLDARRKEAKANGWEDGEDLESMLKSTAESLLMVDEGDLLVRIKDPNQRIQELAYVDATGDVKRISSRTDEGLTYLTTWGDKPQPDWKLRVSMKTPKNLVRYSFALKDVALP